ncbi:RIP metalloprotease RseP [Sulfurospirillum deleyianum]|uniref:Zinc metalloprotease n=1 Tax=Sulfurospirillum deleyianum (strain ATCC 51133 / DSM 6946 / 5175) TaxID=525898 RepID=D1B1W6_SULD5|nr:RIP metalloprotease RseP [Sulfurospirillum deleyianum]ACZ12086.1 membrane-associated zinc metalloprotease [Sulfurospirillum deleyianum DSM 6946]
MGTLTSLLVLSFLIFFHELGHFLAARFFGVHVEVFSIGFGKKVFSKVIGKTEYCFSLIPLGGYVQMKGQDDSDPKKTSTDTDSYSIQSPWKRIVILLAGPFANFLLAFFLYLAIGAMGVTKYAPTIGKIVENSAAFEAGLMENDRIVMINGVLIRAWEDVSTLIQKSQEAITIKVERQGAVHTFSILPKISESTTMFGETIQKKMLGIAPNGQTITLTYGVSELPQFAYEQTLKATTLIITGLQKLIEGVVSPKEMGGIISIVKVTSDASDAGLIALFTLTALISVNLGVFNLLPIPALDGGHIVFNAYELVTRKKPSEALFTSLTMAGWALLLSLMTFTIYNDIDRLIHGN